MHDMSGRNLDALSSLSATMSNGLHSTQALTSSSSSAALSSEPCVPKHLVRKRTASAYSVSLIFFMPLALSARPTRSEAAILAYRHVFVTPPLSLQKPSCLSPQPWSNNSTGLTPTRRDHRIAPPGGRRPRPPNKV